LNSIAAIRAIETQDPELAAKIQLLPIPAGPLGRRGPYAVGVYMIWKFSQNQEAAKQFLVDLATDYREQFIQSQYLQIPPFPGSVRDLGELVTNDARAQPPGKYRLLAESAEWTTNLGHPGYSNAATDEIIKASIISDMFAAAARGETTPEEAVRTAEAKVAPIFQKWRERGKV
jgi:multiple sugar transport system substrate-binding protein